MRKISFLILLMITFTGCSQKKIKFDDYTASIKDFQYEMNKEFSDAETSPLTEEDLKDFRTLIFFPIDSTYKVKARFELEKNPILFEMPTTTDRLPIYKTYGKATFNLQGKEFILHIYQNQELIQKPEYKNQLFIPFTDTTNGIESYGGGRYIDVEIPHSDTIIIDFNRSYNPYCAYSEQFSCPMTPPDNRLNIRIEAGEKIFTV